MMTSNLISRILPPGTGPASVYETLRQDDRSSEASDVEERAGMELDEENLGQGFEDYELDPAEVEGLEESPPIKGQDAALLGNPTKPRPSSGWNHRRATGEAPSRHKWMESTPGLPLAEEGDDEVPPSLLIEEGGAAVAMTAGDIHAQAAPNSSPVPGPSTTEARVQWETTKMHQRLHRDTPADGNTKRGISRLKGGIHTIEPRERAMWRWANVQNLDNFLKDVYEYFLGNGIWCIMLSRALNLMYVGKAVRATVATCSQLFRTLAFVVGFSTFLTMCVDYRQVPHSKTMSQILVPQCIKR